MALRKPIIITNTNTMHHYVEHEKTALLVEKNNLEDMKNAVQRLWNDQSLADTLSQNAQICFESNFSMNAYFSNIIETLRK